MLNIIMHLPKTLPILNSKWVLLIKVTGQGDTLKWGFCVIMSLFIIIVVDIIAFPVNGSKLLATAFLILRLSLSDFMRALLHRAEGEVYNLIIQPNQYYAFRSMLKYKELLSKTFPGNVSKLVPIRDLLGLFWNVNKVTSVKRFFQLLHFIFASK